MNKERFDVTTHLQEAPTSQPAATPAGGSNFARTISINLSPRFFAVS